MNRQFIALMKNRAANGSVGASTIRGMGPRGTAKIIKEYLKEIDLRKMRVASEAAFNKKLNTLTSELQSKLHPKSQHWGAARKCINIFLRNCAFNKYLCCHYSLDTLEQWLEVPLDKHVGTGLIKQRGSSKLPRWPGVIHLTPDQSNSFQSFASVVAARKKVLRVHLDDLFYRGEHVVKA